MIQSNPLHSDAASPDGDDIDQGQPQEANRNLVSQWVVKDRSKRVHHLYTRNEKYSGVKSSFKVNWVKIIPDPQTRATPSLSLAMLTWSMEMALSVWITLLSEDDKYTISRPANVQLRLMLLNAKQEIFKDKTVRCQAMNHAVDKKSIAKDIFRRNRNTDTIF